MELQPPDQFPPSADTSSINKRPRKRRRKSKMMENEMVNETPAPIASKSHTQEVRPLIKPQTAPRRGVKAAKIVRP